MSRKGKCIEDALPWPEGGTRMWGNKANATTAANPDEDVRRSTPGQTTATRTSATVLAATGGSSGGTHNASTSDRSAPPSTTPASSAADMGTYGQLNTRPASTRAEHAAGGGVDLGSIAGSTRRANDNLASGRQNRFTELSSPPPPSTNWRTAPRPSPRPVRPSPPATTTTAANTFEFMPGTKLPGQEKSGPSSTGTTETAPSTDCRPLALFHDPLWGDAEDAVPTTSRPNDATRVSPPRRARPFLDVAYRDHKPAAARRPTPSPQPSSSSPPPIIGANRHPSPPMTQQGKAPPFATLPGTQPGLVQMVGAGGYYVPSARPAMGMLPTTPSQPFPLAASPGMPMVAPGAPPGTLLPGGYSLYGMPVQYMAQPGYANVVAFNPGMPYYAMGTGQGAVPVAAQYVPSGYATMAAPMQAPPAAPQGHAPMPSPRPGTNIEARPFTPNVDDGK